LAAHEGVPLVLRDSAPGLPKKGPPWDIEGELGGSKDFALKRPFEADSEGDAAGHLGHQKKPGRIKTPSVHAPPQISKNHLPWDYTRHPDPPLKPPDIAALRPIERVRDWKRRGWQRGHTPTSTCHAHVTCATCATQCLACRPHPKLCTSNKRRFPHCMQDAFRSSPLTVYEMRGSVERTMFMRAWLCLPTCAHVSSDLLDYLVDYHSVLDLLI
jgi:hypothetical protein